MQEDAELEHPDVGSGVAVGEHDVAEEPGGHAGDEHVLDAEAAEKPRDEEHAAELRELVAGHRAGGFVDAAFVEEEVGEGVVELEPNAYEEDAMAKMVMERSLSRPRTSRWKIPWLVVERCLASGGVAGSVME